MSFFSLWSYVCAEWWYFLFYCVINRERKELKGPERKETDVNLPLFCWQNLSGDDVGQTICCIYVVGSFSVQSLSCTIVRTEASEGWVPSPPRIDERLC